MANFKAKTTTAASGSSLLAELNLGALVAELLGTFILTVVVLNIWSNPIIAAIAVIILVLVLSKLSGGHINPAITVGLLATKQISWVKAVGYIVAQLLGAMLAVIVAQQLLISATDQYGQPVELYKAVATGEWKPFVAELLGGVIIGLGAASVYQGKKEGLDAGFAIGGTYLIALLVAGGSIAVASPSSTAIVNPALALAEGALDTKNMWGIWAYALAPVLGAAAGTLLYKLLQSDIRLGKK